MDRRPHDDESAEGADGADRLDEDELRAREAEASEVEMLLTDAALRPDDPIEGEAVRRGADPDLATEPERGEEP